MLNLADGSRWEISSSIDTASRLEEFARILELRECIGGADHRLTFMRESAAGSHLFAKGGWVTQKLALINLHYHAEAREVVCDLSIQRNPALELFKLQDAIFSIYDAVQNTGGLPLHAALIEYNGNGVVITARGGTGKTTCCNRIPLPWMPLTDDETLIVKSETGEYMAHPFPSWSRYVRGEKPRSWNVERAIPLKAVFFLERAGRQDKAFAISPSEAAIRANRLPCHMLHGVLFCLSQEECRRVSSAYFNNAVDLAKMVPAFVLQATLDGTFWKEMEKVLAWQNFEPRSQEMPSAITGRNCTPADGKCRVYQAE